MKQMTFLQHDDAPTKYTTAAGSPLYVPKDRKPHLLELVNRERAWALLREIEESDVTQEERRFLRSAAQRHAVFNYELIADYYSHATPEMQRLMEASALVIVDIDQAIERGYVRLCQTIRELHMEEVAKGA